MTSPSPAPVCTVRPLTAADFPAAIALWARSPGVCLNQSDTPAALTPFLERNPGLSQALFYGEQLVGAVLCGHDGRRAYLHHLAVDTAWQRRGLARQLVAAACEAVQDVGIQKVNIVLLDNNVGGRAFWERLGFTDRSELQFMERWLVDAEGRPRPLAPRPRGGDETTA